MSTITEINVSKESLVEQLKGKNADEVVGYLGQSYSNPVYNWLNEQVKAHVLALGAKNYSMGVGIRNLGEGDGNGWYLNYDYVMPHAVVPDWDGEYSGQKLIRLPIEISALIGMPQYRLPDPTPPVTAKEALEMLKSK